MNNEIEFKKSTIKKLTIMEKVALFFEEKNERLLFTGLEKQPMVVQDWFAAKNLHNQKLEKLQVYNDLENKKRIRCKGKDFAFSINQDELGCYYLDHLMLGKIEQNDLFLTMRRTKELFQTGNSLQEKNTFTVKRNEKNEQHIIHINEDCIDIVVLKQTEEGLQQTHQIHFHQTEENVIETDSKHSEDKETAFQEFLALEKVYPMITGYINQWMPIVNQVITFCREKETKPYEIKRSHKNLPKVYEKSHL